ncbi:MAG: class I SAM-dependent methyltransferase [Chitinophagaceae bacterium]|nr:class I SAM-dependent methyltransferase [Chitinophagaceae bacterium]
MITQKKNVSEFDSDVQSNDGYKYTSNAPFSSIVANKRITKEIIKFIPKQTKNIIDIGCGDGTYTNDLKNVLPAIHFSAFDPASNAIDLAKTKFHNIEFFTADLLDSKTLPQKKYDVGIIRGVLHHLPSGFEGIVNASKISDTLIIMEPNGNNPILKYIEKHSQYHIEHEEQSFSSTTLTKWFTDANFEVIKLSYIGFVPFFFPTFLAKIIYFFQPLLEKIYLLKKYFGAQIIMYCKKK